MQNKVEQLLKNKIIAKHKSKTFVIIFTLSLLINALGILNYLNTRNDVNQVHDYEKLQAKYPLLARRILQDFPQDILINFLDLRSSLTNHVTPYGDSFSLYFEYLPTGTSIGINGMQEFHAASLFKVPVVMAYFHYLERTKVPDKEVLISQAEIDNQFGDLWKKGQGYNIKLSDAVRLALVNSDNTAAKVVADNIDEYDFQPVYNGLDIKLQTDAKGAILTTKNYASILKALYFSSVINKDDSEKILYLLSQTPFDDKLVAGVGKNITVAHKIGNYLDNDGNKAFTDCGIVYYPRRPYVLCMESKTDEQTAKDRMQAVSKIVYDYINSIR